MSHGKRNGGKKELQVEANIEVKEADSLKIQVTSSQINVTLFYLHVAVSYTGLMLVGEKLMECAIILANIS